MRCEKFASARDVGLAAGAGKQPVVADAVEALRQHVEQEAPDELAWIERHGPVSLVPVAAVVLVAEGHAGLVERDQPAVGDGDAVGVARQIGEHGLGSGEGRLGVDEPVLLAQRRQESSEGAPVAKACMVAEELQPAGRMGLGELGQEEPPEQLGEHAHGQEEAGLQRTQRVPSSEMPPPGTIMWTCGWWVIAEPQRVEHGGDADAGAEVPGIGGDREHRLGRGAEQKVVDHRLVLIGDGGDLGRQREDDVEVADRQQIGLARRQPVPCRRALALGAVPVAAAVVGDAAVAAVLARLDMTAEGCGAAGLDRRHHLQLAEAQMTGMGRAPGGAMAMEDVGDLQRRAAHRRRVRRPVSSRPP